MVVTLSGIVIISSLLQLSNALVPIPSHTLFSSNSTEIGRVVESLKPIEISEEQDFQIAFSTKYLMDALKAFETQEVIM